MTSLKTSAWEAKGGGVSQFFLTVPAWGDCAIYQPMHHGKSEICMTVKEAALLMVGMFSTDG